MSKTMSDRTHPRANTIYVYIMYIQFINLITNGVQNNNIFRKRPFPFLRIHP